jgi:hypothetical protein
MLLCGNGLVGQVKTSPVILLIYTAHLVMTVHKISAANTLCKGAKKLLKLECTIQIHATTHAHDGSTLSSGKVFPRVFQRSASARHWYGCERFEKCHTHTHIYWISMYVGTIHFTSEIKQSLQNANKKIMYKITHCNCHRNVKHQ